MSGFLFGSLQVRIIDMPEFSKQKLIEDLINDGYLKTPQIIKAFEKIDRKDFVPEDLKNSAYLNQPLPIGFNQTISQPLVVAFMLELLEPRSDEKILDVGAGSGWQTALLAEIVGENSKVVAIERIPELKAIAEQNIAKYNFIEKGIVDLVVGDGSQGFESASPFDKIIAAAAAPEIPQAWKSQLNIGGRIVAPVEDSIYVLDKLSQDKFSQKQYFGFSFVPLVEGN